MTGNIVGTSLLLLLIFLNAVASLRAGGRNVKTSYVTYYVSQWTTTKTVTYTRTCTQTCVAHFIFCWDYDTVCRTYPYYKWVSTTKRVARTRPVYSCYSGWRASGDECTIPICTGSCQNGGVCTSPQTCRCTSGWTGSRCRSDVDECQTNQNSCSYKPGCRNTPGSYRCTCRAGYYLMSDQRTCKDLNECTSGQHNCGVNTHCVNNPGSYTCPCNRGFTPDASLTKSCKDINECDPSSGIVHGCQGTCVNIIGSYKCNCSKGHYVASNGRDCTDNDECAGNAHGCSQVCVNFAGGYNCTCEVGYRLDARDHTSCDDVDECSEKISGCAHQCTNEIGSFNCSCKPGYYLGTDSKSCNDIDECSTTNGLHHCQHNCVNIPGSYKCNCRPGFDLLQNGGNCAGRPCFPISPLMNGAKNCSGYTTEEVCHFQCSPGYDLIGSKNRTCSPLRTWTGIETKCKIIHCPTPVEPWNGFVYSPYQTHFGSRCTVGCGRDYYIQGTQTITCDANGVWQPRNITCREIKVCEPNPCLHDGICSSLGPTHYSCDCSNTGYKGVTCDVGYITIPYYPPVTLGIPSQSLMFRASPPSDYIVLTFINRDLEFNPLRLVFQHGASPTQFLRVTARQPGLQFIRYSLSGPNAGEFQLPSPSTIFVRSSANSSSDNELLSNTLPFGCHKKQLNKCPHTNDVIYAASTSPWVKFGPLAMTRGVVNVEIGATNVPLSLVGTNVPNSDLASVPERCSEEDVSYSTEQFLKSRILEQSFLDAVRDSLPKWLNITLRNNNSSRRISTAELKARYLTGKLMRDTDVGEGQPISEESFYSLLMSRNLNLTIQNDVDLLGSRDNNAPMSLALELCGPSSKNVILRPSLGDMDLINDIYVTKTLKENGWNFKFYSLQISKKKLIQKLEKVPFWNGERFFEIPSSVNGDMAIVSSFSKFFGNTSFVNSGVEFEGTMVVNVDDIDNILDSPLDQEWEVDFYGKLTLTAKFKVEGKTTKLILEATQSVGYAKFGGRNLKRRSTNYNYDPRGLFFTNVLQRDPFVYSELNQFVEMGSNKTISCFLDTTICGKENEQSTYSETNNGISMAFHGILKFGPLRFHNLHIQLSMKNAKAQETNSSKNTGVEFTANYNELQKRKFGIFEHTPNTHPNIRLHTARSNNSTSTGSFQTVAKILGFEKLVNVSFSYKGLRFPVTGKIHGLFDASMDCNSILASWENQIFVVTGEFKDKSTEGNLRNSLSENMNRFAVEVLRKAQERMASANETEQRAKARLQNVLLIEKRALEKVKGIRKTYSTAGRELDLAKRELTYLERVARNYSKDVEELKSELDGLCLVKQCPDICQEGNVCNMCYHDIIGKSMGVCPATCFQTKQRRLPPYTEVLLCDKEKCNRIHSTNGLFKKIFGKFFGGIVKSVLSFGITAVATFFGVPPPISAALGSGLVTLFDTGRIDETLCSAGTGALTSFIGGPSVTKVFKQYAKVGIKEAIKKSAVSLGRKGAGALVNKVISCQRDQRDGSWKCHVEQVECTKRVFQYEYEDTPYMCKTSCEKYRITKTVEKTCCSTVPCASFVVNLTCVAENALCKKAREIALNQTSATKANAGKILTSLESARQNVSYWKMKKQKEYIKLMSASRSLNTSQSAVRSLEKAYNVTVAARKRKLELSAKPLKLRTLMDERLESVVMVKLEQIRFNAKVSAGYENTLLPIDLTFQLNGTREVSVSTVLDFEKLNMSLRSIAKEILSHSVGDLSSVSRKKRSVEDIRSFVVDPKLSALKDYHRLCSEFTNYEQTLQNVVRSLYNLSSEVHSLRQNLKNKDEATFNASNVLTRFTLNETMALKFGMNVKNVSYLDYLETDPELFEAKSLIDEAIQSRYEPLELATKLLVYNWFATMEDLFNDSAIADECSGLDDCLTSILNGLYDIYAVVDLPGAQKVREHIRDVETKLSNLTQNIDMSVEDAAEVSSEILKILENMTELNDLCARAPNITKHPEVFTEMGVGETLFLTCNASGGALVYNWRFNDEILQGEASNVLQIKNTTVSHSGNYTCEVSNHIAKEVSTPAVVVVHSPPLITGQPAYHLSVVLSSDASLQCVIENTDRNISYQWSFKSFNSTTFSLLINETFSYLNFAPMQAHQEGWYFCNVSNSYGFSVSTTSFVKALHFTLPVPAATLSLSIVRRPNENATFVKKVNASRYEDISAKVSAMLSSFGNSSTNASEVRVVNLHPVNCQLKRSRAGNKTDHDVEVCSWKFHYLGENATSNTSINDDFKTNAGKVINATIDIKQAVSELLNATNNGSLSFSLDKQTYFVETNSLTVQDFSLLCSQNQMLVQEDFQCVDCPPGYFGKLDENMIASCFPCSLGSYQPNAAQASCIECPEGFTTVYEGSYDKSQCKVICPAGLYGVIVQNIGQCRACPVNTYQPMEGQFECLSCPSGHLTVEEATVDVAKCILEPTQRVTESHTSEHDTVTTVTTGVVEERTTGTLVPEEVYTSDNGSGNGAWIAGVVVGILVLIIGLIIFFVYRLKKKHGDKYQSDTDDEVKPHRTETSDCRVNPVYSDGENYKSLGAIALNPIYDSASDSVSNRKQILDLENLACVSSESEEIKTRRKQPLTFGNQLFQQMMLEKNEEQA